MSERADRYFAAYFGSRSKAAQEILRGNVLKNGKPMKPSDAVSGTECFTFCEAESFVSFGGNKLRRLFDTFPISVKGKVVADLGASTGGFVDCLLRSGAAKVYAVDVGENLLAPSIRSDARVVAMDNTNARYLRRTDFSDPLDAVSIDASFISLTYLLPAAGGLLEDGGEIYALIKPQFECKGKIGKSGIVRDGERRIRIVSDICACAVRLRLLPQGIVNAPIVEKKNIEYMLWLKKGASTGLSPKQIVEMAEKSV